MSKQSIKSVDGIEAGLATHSKKFGQAHEDERKVKAGYLFVVSTEGVQDKPGQLDGLLRVMIRELASICVLCHFTSLSAEWEVIASYIPVKRGLHSAMGSIASYNVLADIRSYRTCYDY